MSQDSVELPEHGLDVVHEIIKENGLKQYETIISYGSNQGDNYMGVIYRIKAREINENDEPKELSLILKVPPPSIAMREKLPIPSLYKQEVFTYNSLFPEIFEVEKKFSLRNDLKVNFVKCFKASDENMKEFLIFEDLSVSGYKMYDRKTSLDGKHLDMAIQSLAKFHAMSLYWKKADLVKFKHLAEFVGNEVNFSEVHAPYFDLCKARALDVITDPLIKKKVEDFCGNFYEKMLYFFDVNNVLPYTVLCHGDCWSNNLLFKYKDGIPSEIMVLDWQMMKHASPIMDLAYLIFTSTDEQTRLETFDQSMDLYFQTLKKKLKALDVEVDEMFPEAAFRDQLSKFMGFGLLSAIIELAAVMGDDEDAPDVDKLLNQETIELSDVEFASEASKMRYAERMNGVARDMVRLKFI